MAPHPKPDMLDLLAMLPVMSNPQPAFVIPSDCGTNCHASDYVAREQLHDHNGAVTNLAFVWEYGASDPES